MANKVLTVLLSTLLICGLGQINYAVQYPVTLVTAYFNFNNRAKHSVTEYKVWAERFFGHINAPVVLHTTLDLRPQFEQMRGSKPTSFVIHADVWQLPCLAGKRAALERQHELDPEWTMHHPELYFVWDSKPCLLAAAASSDPFGSQYFFW